MYTPRTLCVMPSQPTVTYFINVLMSSCRGHLSILTCACGPHLIESIDKIKSNTMESLEPI